MWEEKVIDDWINLDERVEGAVDELRRLEERAGQGGYQAISSCSPSSPLISLASTPNQSKAASAFSYSTLLPSQKNRSFSVTQLYSSLLTKGPNKQAPTTLRLTPLAITQKRPQRKRIRSSLMMMVWPPTQKRILGCLQTIMENVKKHRWKMLRK